MDEYKQGMVGYTSQRAPVKPQLPLADYEKDTIAYFFAKLKLTDQRFYTQAMPDEKTEQITKRDYANQLRYRKAKVIAPGTDVTVISEGDVIHYDKSNSFTMLIQEEQMTIIRESDVVVVVS